MTKSRNDIDFSQVESDTKIKGCLLKHLGEEAKPILGDDVCFKNSCKEYGEIWKTMKLWLRQYIMQESGTHIIRYLTPEKLI